MKAHSRNHQWKHKRRQEVISTRHD